MTTRPEDVRIPERWASMHHLQRRQLAALLRKVNPGDLTPEAADRTIRDELARRAALTTVTDKVAVTTAN